MACKGAKKKQANFEISVAKEGISKTTDVMKKSTVERLLFGVDSEVKSNTVLQNNITEFEWATRNKIYPSFWGRNLVGDNALSKGEIEFLHRKACKLAATYTDFSPKITEEQGQNIAKNICSRAKELEIPEGIAIFLEIGETETATRDFMRGFAKVLIDEGFVPAFKANTDASFSFDREYSRGLQTDKDIFEKCLIWAVSPSLTEYDRVTTTHLIHPDEWRPFAPSGITRQDIAIWQYGKNCHPIEDDLGKETSFNINLVRNEKVIIEKMF